MARDPSPPVPSIAVENCSFAYGNRRVLESVSLQVLPGEFVVVAGPNGAGKTTLLRLVSGILPPSSGRIRLEGVELADLHPREVARKLAVVPQDSTFHFPYRVGEAVRMGRAPYLGLWGFESEEDVQAGDRAMRMCDLGGLAARGVHELSGGERQRVIIARALAQQTRILVLDEPTAALDLRHAWEVLRILQRVRGEQGTTVVVITHDLTRLAPVAERIVLLKQGRVVADGSPERVLTPEQIHEVFEVPVEIHTDRHGRRLVVPMAVP